MSPTLFTYVNEDKLIPGDKSHSPDRLHKGTVYDYLLPVFSSHLHMQGDTELGLCVKYFLGGLDMDSRKVPAYLESVLQKSLPLYQRLFG